MVIVLHAPATAKADAFVALGVFHRLDQETYELPRIQHLNLQDVRMFAAMVPQGRRASSSRQTSSHSYQPQRQPKGQPGDIAPSNARRKMGRVSFQAL